MIQCNVQLRVISVLVVTDIERRDDVCDWCYVQRDQNGPEDGTLGYAVDTGRWWRS